MVWHATIAGLGPALIWVFRDQPFFDPALAIGLPMAAVAVASLVKSAASHPPEIKWDRQGIHYLSGGETHEISWSEYRGHRVAWNYLPSRLKLFGLGKKPIIIDTGLFDTNQREMLIDELGMHEAALPNTRLKLTARVD